MLWQHGDTIRLFSVLMQPASSSDRSRLYHEVVKEESSDESTVVSSKTSTLTRDIGMTSMVLLLVIQHSLHVIDWSGVSVLQ